MIWLQKKILWRKDRHIIQIGIDARDEEQGVRNSLDDIKPIKKVLIVLKNFLF